MNAKRKTTTLFCVTRRVVVADLNFKQQFDSMPFRLGLLIKIVQSQSYSNTSKVIGFGKVYFAPFPLHVLLGPCGCFFDNKNIKFNCLMNIGL